MNNVLRVILLLFVLAVEHVHAVTCSSIFSAGAQSHSANGFLEMNMQSRILNGGSSLKVPRIVDNSGYGWLSCGTAKCSGTGGFNSVVNYSVPVTNGSNGAINVAASSTVSRVAGQYTSVNVGQEATLNFSTSGGKYYMSSLTTNWKSKLNFAPGDYYINGDLLIQSENVVSLTGNGPVRIFVNGSVTIHFNTTVTHSNPANLLIYAKNTISFLNAVKFTGFLYSQTGDALIGFMSQMTGGVSAAGRIYMDNDSLITYSNSANTADFGALCTSTPSINNFNINVGTGAATTCSDFRVTITARDSNNSPLTGYTGTISLTTSTNRGIWKKTGVTGEAYGNLTATTTDNGQATYTFTTQDAGDITLLLDNQHAQSLMIRVVDGGVSSTSGTVTFSANAFVIESTDSLSNDLIAGRSHSFAAKMMTQDLSSPTKTCRVASFYNNTNVKMWLVRDAVDPIGTAPAIKKDAQTLSPPNSEPTANNINLAFNSGVANFTLLASDVGKYRVAIADTSKIFSSSDIRGQSEMLTARPFGIRVSIAANPAATDSSGATFRAAGQAFTLTVAAVAWDATDDQNNDGIPDGHDDNSPGNNANLGNNAALVSFGKEKPAKGITASAILVAPAGGNNPGLSGAIFTDFTVGTASSALVSFGEVGIIEISASVTGGDYLGSPGSAKIIGKSGYVGRFIPDRFSLSGLSVTPACNSGLAYSYLGENFSLAAAMTPYGANGVALKNYIQGFDKFNKSAAPSMFYAVDAASASNLTSRLLSPSPTTVYAWSNGVLNATPSFNISRLANPDGPFTQVKMGFKPVDTDGVTLRTGELNLDVNNDGVMDAAIVGNPFRLFYGRLRLDDSYGPETANLPVIFRTEYWNGSEWRQNRDDSCTKIAANKIRYPGGLINVVANRSTAVGAGSTTGVYANLDATSVNFSAGDAGHYFTAPGAGNTGSVTVQVDLANYPWLQFDWNGDGIYSDASLPNARFTFGNYRGHDRVLYWIESSKH
jgi:hypothetical protein